MKYPYTAYLADCLSLFSSFNYPNCINTQKQIFLGSEIFACGRYVKSLPTVNILEPSICILVKYTLNEKIFCKQFKLDSYKHMMYVITFIAILVIVLILFWSILQY